MTNTDTYKSIAAVSQGLYKDQGSRFLAFAFPVETEEQVKEKLSELRREYNDARHCCSACRLGLNGDVWRASDDGEPSGTAGRPILGQIDSAGLSDILVIVVRYFGGIKLGVPGLIKAYKEATADALSKASVVEKVAGNWYRLDFDYSRMPEVMKMVKDMQLPSRAQSFDQKCSMEVRVRLKIEDDFLKQSEKMAHRQKSVGDMLINRRPCRF